MASINAITGGLSSTASLRGYGGLSSGLDRDTLIEQLTYGTRTKIEQQKQRQDLLKWQQASIRNIIDKVYDFSNKFTSYASPNTNLTSALLFARTDITAVGENSKYVSVTGAPSDGNLFSIAGIKQMAKDAKLTGEARSISDLKTGSIDFSKPFQENTLAGEYVSVQYGNDTYYISFGDENLKDANGKLDTKALEEAINKAIGEVDLNKTIDGKSKLSDVMKATVDRDGKVTFERTDAAKNDGNNLEITGGSGDVLKTLGILGKDQELDKLPEDALKITADKGVTGANAAEPLKEVAVKDFLAGKSMTFEYNGTSKTITLGDDIDSLDKLKTDLQNKLNDAFGNGRVTVGEDSGRLTFKTTTPDGKEDKSSMLTLVSADSGLLGESGILGVKEGMSNRVKLDGTLGDSGLLNGVTDPSKLKLTINGVDIKLIDENGNTLKNEDGSEKTFADATVEEIITAINNTKEAGVTVSYQKNADRFVVTSNEKGASGSVKLEGNVAEAMFGASAVGEANAVKGQDAIVAIKYPGDDDVTLVTRDSNSFTMDGVTVNLKGTFGFDASGNIDPTTEEVTFDAKVDSENTTKVVKEMITAFNEILELINTEAKTKPDRDYAPLTGTQKEDMSEKEIEEYEKKAKEGLLFGDTDLRGFSDALRFILPVGDREALREIGITTSTDYADNGKLVLDEAKFKAALETNPEKVEELFTRTASEDANGNPVEGGFMSKIKDVMNNYAGTMGATKGILVERAGSAHAPTSILQNTLQKQIDDMNKTIDRLLDRLESEEDRYIKQFTSLETLISQMNSQSSYLAQMSGGY